MATYYVGEVMAWPGTALPDGWLPCDGSTQTSADYSSLSGLLGNTFGQGSSTTFVLPDLRGRVALGAGIAASGTTYTLGQTGGESGVVLSIDELPGHTHALFAANVAGDTDVPGTGVALSSLGPVELTQDAAAWSDLGGPQVMLAGGSIGSTGDGQSHPNIQPSTALQYMICYAGVYPTS